MAAFGSLGLSDYDSSGIPKVIYGIDNRINFSAISDPSVIKYARATAAMISKDSLSAHGSRVSVEGVSLATVMLVCPGESFSQELAAANCSGFLVAPDVLVTAGHCITSMSDCRGNNWVFDFTDRNADRYGQVEVPLSSVYSCSQVLDQSLDSNLLDYAVIKLDRAVTDRVSLKVRRSGTLLEGTALTVIGYPSGLPLKVSPGARVRDASSTVYFTANLDTYGGNSGSAVLNSVSGDVEGILVRGENDYNWDSARSCNASNHCTDEGCRGEEVTRITQVRYLNGGQSRQPSVPTPAPTPAPTSGNSCEWAYDGVCDDGRPGSEYSVCSRGSDENDCRGI